MGCSRFGTPSVLLQIGSQESRRAGQSHVVEQSPKNVTVSVVVPVRNTPVELIERALTSALTQEIDEGIIELVVIDDASTDKGLKNYLKRFRGVKHSRNSRQLGEGKSKELGGHLSQGRFLFFLDADD